MTEQVVIATRGRTAIAARCDNHALAPSFQGPVGTEVTRAGASCQSARRRGEDLVVTYLEDIDWQILEYNWRPDRGLCGELDITAPEPGHAYCELGGGSVADSAQGWAEARLVIVKARTRSSLCQGPSTAAVDTRKVARLRTPAVAWVNTRETPLHTGMRLDVVSISMRDVRSVLLYHHRTVDVSWG